MRINISCSRHIFICFGRKSFRLTINQRLQRESLLLSGHAAVGFEWGLSSQIVIFIHQPHLFTADLHRDTAMFEVPQEIFILRDQKKKQRNLFFGNLWALLSVHQFWTWHSWETEQWLSLSAAALPPDNRRASSSASLPGPEFWLLHPRWVFWRLWENPWYHRHRFSCVSQCDLNCMPAEQVWLSE